MPRSFRVFVLNPQVRHCPGTLSIIAGALRYYLRFRALQGDRVSHLLYAVPKAANWRLATLPQVFTDAEINRLLAVRCPVVLFMQYNIMEVV